MLNPILDFVRSGFYFPKYEAEIGRKSPHFWAHPPFRLLVVVIDYPVKNRGSFVKFVDQNFPSIFTGQKLLKV